MSSTSTVVVVDEEKPSEIGSCFGLQYLGIPSQVVFARACATETSYLRGALDKIPVLSAFGKCVKSSLSVPET